MPEKLAEFPDVSFHITEFPFFTFLFADLRAHMMAIPFTLLVIGLGLNLVVGLKDGGWLWTIVSAAALALGLGSLWVVNSWDFPSYLILTVGLLSVAADLERVAAIREAIGDEMGLFVDANHAYNAHTAIRMGRGLEKYGVLFFEEPVPPEDRAGYRRVRETLDIAIAGGECEFTRYGFRDLISEGCVDIIQPDLTVTGGFSELIKIQALASMLGVS